jgi:hypothetical protein
VSAQVTPAGTFLGDQATIMTLNMTWLPVLFPGVFTNGGHGIPPIPI